MKAFSYSYRILFDDFHNFDKNNLASLLICQVEYMHIYAYVTIWICITDVGKVPSPSLGSLNAY